MTPLTRKVTRRSIGTYKDGQNIGRLVVTLYSTDCIGLRIEKTKREERLSFALAYKAAVQDRLAIERELKAKRKGGRS